MSTPEGGRGPMNHSSVVRPAAWSCSAASASRSNLPACASASIWRSQASASNAANHARRELSSSAVSCWICPSICSSRLIAAYSVSGRVDAGKRSHIRRTLRLLATRAKGSHLKFEVDWRRGPNFSLSICVPIWMTFRFAVAKNDDPSYSVRYDTSKSAAPRPSTAPLKFNCVVLAKCVNSATRPCSAPPPKVI